MGKSEDQERTGELNTDLVNDDNYHERQPWRFCNSMIPQWEVVKFSFYSSFDNKFHHNCVSGKTGVFQTWIWRIYVIVFFFLLAQVDTLFANQIFSTIDWLFMGVCGP